MQEDDTDPSELPPSKSQLKRDAHALQKLGVALLERPESDWQALALPENLIAALREAKRLQARGAHKRQLQYIGKLMRGIDPAPIQAHFEQLRLQARQQARALHDLEDWRDRMLESGDSAIDAYLEECPHADRQHLRQLVRQARKEIAESAENKAPKSARALFRYLREQDTG